MKKISKARGVSFVAVASVLSVLLVTGCSKQYQDLPAFWPIPFRDAENYSVGRFKTTYMADQIHAYFRGNMRGVLAVATFVNLDDLYGSSTFGRIVAEQLMSELAMRGYQVIELRQSEALQVMEGEGEFGLSRDVGTLRRTQEISGLVVGTYAVSPVRVYINARLIDPQSSLISSVATVELSKTDELDRLLRTNMLPYAMERIPVRQLGSAVYPFPSSWSFGASSMPQASIAPDRFDLDDAQDQLGPNKNSETNARSGAARQSNAPLPTLDPRT